MNVKTKHTPKSHPQGLTVGVPVEFEVIEVFSDVIPVGPRGEQSIGSCIDQIVQEHFDRGSRLGRVTIDLAELSKAFGPGLRSEQSDRSD